MINNIKRIFNNIKRIFKWIPILWKDRDDDYYYLYKIMKFKLILIKNNIAKYSLHEDKQIFWITCSINLLDKLMNEYYLEEFQLYLEKDYNITNNNVLSSNIINDNLDKFYLKYKNEYKLLENKNEFINADRETKSILISIYNHDRAKRLLFSILEYKIEKFWH